MTTELSHYSTLAATPCSHTYIQLSARHHVMPIVSLGAMLANFFLPQNQRGLALGLLLNVSKERQKMRCPYL